MFNKFIFKILVEVFIQSPLIPVALRGKLLRVAGVKVGNASIRSNCYFSSSRIEIGKNTFINSHCKFYSTEKGEGYIKIGENCDIAMGTLITTMTHEIGENQKRAGDNLYLPVIVGNGCWIGANATILPGVTIGDGCIIAAGAVVTKDCESNGLYAGVPAKRIKDLPSRGNVKKAI
ncbi:acyltransferase [Neobacillus thermocopriae]|uniref:acyltransferase n=1 Tax=Neobacillus thermocopriae TaxID=1215031 RepID=UPI002E1D3DA9|nr:acyltransferase [Neobacillus thermocopriae]MED3714368.1 acyltransferase [Neobacillus thermocopriae]